MGQTPKGYCHLVAEISISRNGLPPDVQPEVKVSGEVISRLAVKPSVKSWQQDCKSFNAQKILPLIEQ